MTVYIGVKPAYGRDYSSQRQVREAWDAGKDFQITDHGRYDGSMINKAGTPAGATIIVRYADGRKQMTIKGDESK
jgi:hypothetical protein